ncbi:hypothetical protein OE810_00425 [Rhodobacteraceae bacterium XHP0102]|nr:hypothetical protein [Rhodobacteraceae bacterium XHP0102]
MKFKATEDIDAPLELVFERFCDFRHIEDELTGRGAKLTREGGWVQPRKGASWSGEIKLRGRARPVSSQITSLIHEEALTIESQIGGMQSLYELRFQGINPQMSRVSATLELKPTTLSARLVIQSLKLARGRVLQRMTGYLVRRGNEVEAEFRASLG